MKIAPRNFKISFLNFLNLLLLTKCWDSRHVALAKFTVFVEESESEVKKGKLLEPGEEK